MNKLAISIPIGLGDLIHVKSQLDFVAFKYDVIELAFYEPFFTNYRSGNTSYIDFITEFYHLIFDGNPKYKLVAYDNQPFRNPSLLCSQECFVPIRPLMRKELCDIDTELPKEIYLTISTKIRSFHRKFWDEIKEEVFSILNSKPLKIMFLGEKEIEYNPEYAYYGTDNIYSIYQELCQNIPADKIIDKTIPKLGITTPNIANIRKDCAYLAGSKKNIMVGIGGNFCLAVAVGNSLGYRNDEDHVGDILYSDRSPVYSDLKITKRKDVFLEELRRI